MRECWIDLKYYDEDTKRLLLEAICTAINFITPRGPGPYVRNHAYWAVRYYEGRWILRGAPDYMGIDHDLGPAINNFMEE